MAETTGQIEESYAPATPTVNESNEQMVFGSCICESCDQDGCTGL